MNEGFERLRERAPQILGRVHAATTSDELEDLTPDEMAELREEFVKLEVFLDPDGKNHEVFGKAKHIILHEEGKKITKMEKKYDRWLKNQKLQAQKHNI